MYLVANEGHKFRLKQTREPHQLQTHESSID